MNTFETNPLFIAYKEDTNLAKYAKPTGVAVVTMDMLDDPEVIEARAKGMEVFEYVNVVSRPDARIGKFSEEFYMQDHTIVPLWPLPTYGERSIYMGSKLTDIRVGSIWSNYVVQFLSEKVFPGTRSDGIFLDVLGSQLWKDWGSWSKTEQDAWNLGAVDIMRRMDEARREVNPNFKLVTNNVWNKNPEADRYIDGVCLEHFALTSLYHRNYASREFSDLGHRRVFVIGNTELETKGWADTQGVTHVSYIPPGSAGVNYGFAWPPVVEYHDLKVTELETQIAKLKSDLAAMTENYKNEVLEHAVTAGNLSIAELDLQNAQEQLDKAIRKIGMALKVSQDLAMLLAV